MSGGAIEQAEYGKIMEEKTSAKELSPGLEASAPLLRKEAQAALGKHATQRSSRPVMHKPSPVIEELHKDPKGHDFCNLNSFVNSQALHKMTRLMISVLDERRDPDFEAYARGYPSRPLLGSSKEKEYVMTSLYAVMLEC